MWGQGCPVASVSTLWPFRVGSVFSEAVPLAPAVRGSALSPVLVLTPVSVRVRVCLHVFKWCELFRIKKCTQMRRFYTPDKLVHFLYKMWVFLHEIPGTAACSREVTPRSPAAGRVCRVDSGWHHRPARPRTRAGAPSVLAAVGSWWRVQLFIALTVGLLRIPPHGARCETKGPMTPL